MQGRKKIPINLMRMRRKILYLLCAALAAGGIEAAEFSVKSPDGKLEAKLEDGK